MATVITSPSTQQQTLRPSFTGPGLASVSLCTVFALLLLGYHPAAEDGGIYAAAIAARLQPGLFPAEHGFAIAHTAYGVFVPMVMLLVHVSHLSLAATLLLTYVTATAFTLAAACSLLKVLCPIPRNRLGALLFFSAALGLPIAGTSLYLVDPYLTARSLSTPLLLFSLSFFLRRRTWSAALCIAMALLVHPMMTTWVLPVFATLLTVRSTQPVRNTGLFATLIFLAMAALQRFGAPDHAALQAASLSRDYWFPARWQSYEVLGLLAPPALLLFFAPQSRSRWLTAQARGLATATALASAAVAVAGCCLIHASDRSLLLARLQPMRLLHFMYCIFLILLGVGATSIWRGRLQWIAVAIAAVGLLFMQRQLYAHSNHFELPGRAPSNGYEQAFLWIRQSTPLDALFALDADYTRSPGEDAQLFRAVALRSALPDAAKDGGISSVVPSLAAEWWAASNAQLGLAQMTDTERLARIRPLGATWIVLPAASTTHFQCPYRNETAQVCRLPSAGGRPDL